MTLKDKLKAYTRTPGSLIVMLLVMLSAILTFAVLIYRQEDAIITDEI